MLVVYMTGMEVISEHLHHCVEIEYNNRYELLTRDVMRSQVFLSATEASSLRPRRLAYSRLPRNILTHF